MVLHHHHGSDCGSCIYISLSIACSCYKTCLLSCHRKKIHESVEDLWTCLNCYPCEKNLYIALMIPSLQNLTWFTWITANVLGLEGCEREEHWQLLGQDADILPCNTQWSTINLFVMTENWILTILMISQLICYNQNVILNILVVCMVEQSFSCLIMSHFICHLSFLSLPHMHSCCCLVLFLTCLDNVFLLLYRHFSLLTARW